MPFATQDQHSNRNRSYNGYPNTPHPRKKVKSASKPTGVKKPTANTTEPPLQSESFRSRLLDAITEIQQMSNDIGELSKELADIDAKLNTKLDVFEGFANWMDALRLLVS